MCLSLQKHEQVYRCMCCPDFIHAVTEPWTKQFEGEKGLLQVTIRNWVTSGQELKQKCKHEPWKTAVCWLVIDCLTFLHRSRPSA